MSLLLDSTIKVSVVVLLALIAVGLLRKRSAALRHWIVAAAVICGAAVPVFGWMMPTWPLPLKISARIEPLAAPLEPIPTLGEKASLTLISRQANRADVGRIVTVVPFLLTIWMVGVGVSLCLLASGFARLTWLASRAERICNGRWVELADEMSRHYGLHRHVVLLQGAQSALLAAWGLLWPRIILPASAGQWTEERVRIVLAHELAHIQRRDWLTQIIAEMLRSIYWFNPLVRRAGGLVWIACQRLRRESEQACDDAVLKVGVEPSAYATQLVTLARALRPPYSAALGLARSSSLEKRIAAID